MFKLEENPDLVGYCGQYCGACEAYLNDKCDGCQERSSHSLSSHDYSANSSASWCKVKACCIENKISTCADCPDYDNPRECRKFNNIGTKLVNFFHKSDRVACIRQIREIGLRGHACRMAQLKSWTIKLSG